MKIQMSAIKKNLAETWRGVKNTKFFDTDQEYSKALVDLLKQEGKTVPEIAKMAGTTPAKINQILAGEAKFTTAQTDKLGKADTHIYFRFITTHMKKVSQKVGRDLKQELAETADKGRKATLEGYLKLTRLAGKVASRLSGVSKSGLGRKP